MYGKPRFPFWSNPNSIKCFQCGKPLAAIQEEDKGYPPGYGQYRRTCPCGYHTYYDRPPAP